MVFFDSYSVIGFMMRMFGFLICYQGAADVIHFMVPI